MTDPASLEIPVEIKTPRPTLRCPAEDDGPIVFASVRESLDGLRRFGGSLREVRVYAGIR